jgi:polyisoprenoid-binding protein YceI
MFMVRSSAILTILFTLLLVCSCANPATNQPKAVTGRAAPVSSSSPAVQGEKYLIAPDNSKFEFFASKVTGSHHGSFGKFSGAIDFNGQAENSSVTISIDTASVITETPDLTKHLQTPDFFDVAKYPQATFTSTEIKRAGDKDKGGLYNVTGNLQLHGVTKAITFPAVIVVTPDAVTVDSTFSINRKDFGINFAGAADNLIRDEVLLTLHVRGVK